MDTIRRSIVLAPGGERLRWCAIVAAFIGLVLATSVLAQAPAASGAPPREISPEELKHLVGPIALYPDDLVAIILPASTNPLQLVQADRFLDKRKSDPKLPVDERWDEPVKALLNYPDVVKKMSNDLDWTTALGEAVVTNQGDVLDAVQAFRREAQAAGNLKTDDKQVVVVEKQIVEIRPANPEVIYVPQYNPATVIVAGGGWGYYPAPYPVYYYPYPPGAAFATGVIWGAALGAAWNGGHWHTDYHGGNNTINIDRSRTTNITNTNISGGNRVTQRPAGGGTQWKPNRTPAQVSGSLGRPSSRVGDARASGARPSQQPVRGTGVGDRGAVGNRGGAAPSQQPGRGTGVADRGGAGSRGGAAPSQQPARSGGAFGDYGSRRQTQLDSARGASSRSSFSGGRSGGLSGGGGRAGGGGGGRGGGGRGR